MSVTIDASGRRSKQLEFVVDGTPEDVWQAIATGPGISSWLMPAEIEKRDGKPVALKISFGPGVEMRANVTTWDPPRVFAAQADDWMPGVPPIATEWQIEARAGGTCTVRIVQSLFASTDEWDDQLDGAESGWSAFLATLRIYLKHFRGSTATLTKLMVPTTGTEAEVWDKLTSTIGLKGLAVGQRWTTPAGLPVLAGVAEYFSAVPYDALLRLDAPGPAIVAFGTVAMGGPTMVGMNIYAYDAPTAASAERDAARWQAWFAEYFPAPAEAEESAGS